MSWHRTPDPSIVNFEVFCNAVDASRHLWNAPLVKTCTYIEKGKRVTPHRCLIIDVCLGATGHVWLRLDRRPSSAVALASRGGTTRSNDEVTIARTISELKLEKYELENVQVFPESAPTLRTLARVLRAFENNVKTYNLFSRNCWFLCSVIEELLPGEGGLYAAGEGQNLQLGLSTRKKVSTTLVADESTLPSLVAASATTPPPSIYPFQRGNTPLDSSSYHATASQCTHRTPLDMCATYIALYLRDSVQLSVAELRSLSRMLNQECLLMLRQIHSEGEKDYANHMIALHLHEYAGSLFNSKGYLKAAEVETRSVEMTRVLHQHRPDLYKVQLPDRLQHLGLCYDWGFADEFARDPAAETVQLWRGLSERDPPHYILDLAMSLYDYGLNLRKLGSYQDACSSHAESVALTRKLYLQNPDAHISGLAMRLQEYAHSLYACGSYPEACDAHAESVNLTRKLYLQNPDAHISNLAEGLYMFGISLHTRGSYPEACDAHAESVNLTRKLYLQNPDAHISILAERLRNYGASLRESGFVQEACNASAEAVTLMRQLCEQESEEHAPGLAFCLCTQGICLSKLGSFQKSCDVLKESAALRRQLHHQNNFDTHDLHLFADGLHHYGLALHTVGLYEDACEAKKEAVELTRLLHDQNPKKYSSDLEEWTQSYQVSLRALQDLQTAASPPTVGAQTQMLDA